MEGRTPVFLYGDFMSRAVLRRLNVDAGELRTAHLHDYDVSIRPLANLDFCVGSTAFGIVAWLRVEDLQALAHYADAELGVHYRLHPVLVRTGVNVWEPVMCHVVDGMEAQPATAEYVDRVLEAAIEHGLPDWYIRHLEGFAPLYPS